MILDTLITNRTAADVARVKALSQKGFAAMTATEKAEYLSGLKGAYNASDLNRVGEAVEYVADRLNTLGGFDLHPVAKQDWTDEDIPTAEQLAVYLEDIAIIREAYETLAPDTPESAERLSYTDANNIETILLAADAMLERVMASFVYSGQPYSGQIWEEFDNDR